MVKSATRPAVQRVTCCVHSAHVISAGGHGNLGFANRADQRVIDVDVDNELTIQQAPRSHNMFIYDSLHAKLSDSGSLAGLGEVCQIRPIFSRALYDVAVCKNSWTYLNADALRFTCALPRPE